MPGSNLLGHRDQQAFPQAHDGFEQQRYAEYIKSAPTLGLKLEQVAKILEALPSTESSFPTRPSQLFPLYMDTFIQSIEQLELNPKETEFFLNALAYKFGVKAFMQEQLGEIFTVNKHGQKVDVERLVKCIFWLHGTAGDLPGNTIKSAATYEVH